MTGGAQAATIGVTTAADELDADNECSLREAIQSANTDAAGSGCAAGSGADTITVPAGFNALTRVGASEEGNAISTWRVTSPSPERARSSTATTSTACCTYWRERSSSRAW